MEEHIYPGTINEFLIETLVFYKTSTEQAEQILIFARPEFEKIYSPIDELLSKPFKEITKEQYVKISFQLGLSTAEWLNINKKKV